MCLKKIRWTRPFLRISHHQTKKDVFCRLLAKKLLLQQRNARNWTSIALLKKVQCSRQIYPPLQVNCHRGAKSITNPSNPQKTCTTFARLLQRFPLTMHWKRWNVDALREDGNWTIEISMRHREYIFRALVCLNQENYYEYGICCTQAMPGTEL